MDRQWLIQLFEEAGLEAEDARKVADATLRRILHRKRKGLKGAQGQDSMAMNLIRDPLSSMSRIVGRDDEGLPFIDPDTGRLSVAAFGDIMNATGMDPAVSIAHAKVVAEAYDPEHLYEPVWRGLGHEEVFDIEALRRADWSSLRREFPDLVDMPFDRQATRPMVRAKPRARPPVRGRKGAGRAVGRGRPLPPRKPR